MDWFHNSIVMGLILLQRLMLIDLQWSQQNLGVRWHFFFTVPETKSVKSYFNQNIDALTAPRSGWGYIYKITPLYIASDKSHDLLQLVTKLVVAIYYWPCGQSYAFMTNRAMKRRSPRQVVWLFITVLDHQWELWNIYFTTFPWYTHWLF